MEELRSARVIWPWFRRPESERAFSEQVVLEGAPGGKVGPVLVLTDRQSGKVYKTRMLTTVEAAAYLGISPGRVRALAVSGRLGYLWKVGRGVLIPEVHLAIWADGPDRDRRRRKAEQVSEG